jgi:hypothetical protein
MGYRNWHCQIIQISRLFKQTKKKKTHTHTNRLNRLE